MAATSGLLRIAWLARPGALGANQISADVGVAQPRRGLDRRVAELAPLDRDVSGCAARNRGNRSPAIIGGVIAHEPGMEATLLLARPGAGGRAGLVDGGQRSLRLLEERLAGRCHRHPARIAVEQPDPDLHLESRDRLRERRLRELESPSRAGHLTLVRRRSRSTAAA